MADEQYRFADSVFVDATPEQVYDVVSDVTRTGEWSVFTRACEWDEGSLDADGRPVVGASFTGHNSRPGRDWDTRSEVVVADRGRQFAWAVNGGLVRWGYEMAPEGPASGTRGTRLTQRWEFTPEGREFIRGKFGEDGVALRVEDARSGIPTTLERVRRVVEAEGGTLRSG